MRKAVVALSMMLGVQGPALAQTPWAHKLFAGDVVHDFGVVPRGAQLKYSFKMTNIYKVPLEITEVKVGCDCVSAKESVKVLQPGESAAININMDGRRVTGPKTVKVFVTVGPQYVDTATLIVQANARLDVVFNPGEIDFGLIHLGQSPTKFIDVEYASTFPWSIKDIIKVGDEPFDLTVEPLANKAVKGFRIHAKVKPDAPAGAFNREVMLKTNDPSGPVFTFHVLGNVQATLSVQPDNLKLDAVKVGDKKSQKILVRGSRPFRITAIDGQGDGITATSPDRQATVHVVEVQFQPTEPGELKKQLTIRTDLDNEAVTVTVQGSGS